MKQPKVRFKTNKDLDIWAGKMFENISKREVLGIYKKQENNLIAFSSFAQELWDGVSEEFYKITNNLFGEHKWPKGNYIGFVSVCNGNPRFLKNKTFQVYYKHSAGPVYVTAHEMLHFIFYDYALKKHANLFRNKDTESGIFWDVAEILNVIILHEPEFIKIHKMKKVVCYPEHKKLINQFRKIWRKEKNIDKFITMMHKTLIG